MLTVGCSTLLHIRAKIDASPTSDDNATDDDGAPGLMPMQKPHETQASPAPWCPIAPRHPLSPARTVTAIKFGSVVVTLVFALACSAGAPSDETPGGQDYIPTPDRSQVVIIDRGLPDGLTDPAASAAYQQGYSHMLDATWFAAIAAYDEAIRIQPEVAGLYEARGTAYIYAGQHDDALADYGHAIELDPTPASGASEHTPTRLRRHPSPKRVSRTPHVQ